MCMSLYRRNGRIHTIATAGRMRSGSVIPVIEIVIAVEDPRRDDVRALQERHRAWAMTTSPPEDVYALDPDALAADGITVYGARSPQGRLVGIGAIKEIEPAHGEIKSMHTDAQARGAGVAKALLTHLLEVARTRGYRRVSLETGTMDAFAPARALYARAGFMPCAPFGEYAPSRHSVCMTLPLG